jgi:CRP-like cAMP-binding protein
MNADADTVRVAGLPLFSLLSEAERATLNGLFTPVDVRRGEHIFREGDPGGALYFVRTGRVQIVLEGADGQRIIVSENGPGSIFGEVSLLDGGPRTAGAIAATDAELLTLDRDDLLEFVTRHPPASLALLTVMGRRLRSTNELLRTNASRNVNDEERAILTPASRASNWLTGSVGTWGFVLADLALAAAGLVLATTGLGATAPGGRDPLLLWLGVVVVLVSLQAAALLLARNRQSEKDRLKADLDYQFNLKAELELARLNRKVDELDARVRSQIAGLELDKALATPVRPGTE